MLISVCLPVYGTESVLAQCLESAALAIKGAATQDFELVIVNDASPKPAKGIAKCEKIVKVFKKSHKDIPLVYYEHRDNLGCLETRRDLVLNAHGDYILMLDSDDLLTPQALTLFANGIAQNPDADIIQGGTETFTREGVTPEAAGNAGRTAGEAAKATETSVHGGTTDKTASHGETATETTCPQEAAAPKKTRLETMMKLGSLHEGYLKGREILTDLLQNGYSTVLWNKAIRRTTYLAAFDQIPFTFCTMGEDFLISFFIALEAKKYFGFKDIVYRYNVDAGITSTVMIKDINRWRRVCNVSSVFTTIYAWMADNPQILTEEEKSKIKFRCANFVANNLLQLEKTVIPELKEAAMQEMYTAWGEELVREVAEARGGKA